ncbi:MAG TPA: hypothetical protein VMS86_04515 [Thermoanaerobaculia bacterium]|nr:hypothetical protein [Thermoanaerobaculia bacterium]
MAPPKPMDARSGLEVGSVEPRLPRTFRSPRKLPYLGRVVAGILAWILLVIGLAGLVLPGVQGVLTLALSATMFSLTSTRAHERLRSAFRPWPKGWRRVIKVRLTLERRLAKLR